MITLDVNATSFPDDTRYGESSLTHFLYNGLDCLVTLEVHKKLSTVISDLELEKSYQRSLGENSVAVLMGLRGIAVNNTQKEAARKGLEADIKELYDFLEECCLAMGMPETLNPNSPKQMKQFFFGLTPVPRKKEMLDYSGVSLRAKAIYSFAKGERKLSCDRNTLEKLAKKSPELALFSRLILDIRDLEKQNEVFVARLHEDGRMHCQYGVAATDTYRWNSSETPDRRGRNLQNIAAKLRRMFVASKGKKIAYIDYEQAESRIVAYRSGDPNYIAACEGGDLHTTVCMMIWPDMPWKENTNENLSYNKSVAETVFYRDFTHRDMSKRGGHATNYYGKPLTVAKNLNVEKSLVEGFQRGYFGSFSGIPDWHEEVRHTLLAGEPLVTAFGRHRVFFGRANDDTTLRAAIAYEPQSTLSSLVKQAHVNIYRKEADPRFAACGIEILHDLHDALLVEYWDEAEEEALELIEREMIFPVRYPSGDMIIPVEAASGWSWGYPAKDGSNPDGLMKWKGSDPRSREIAFEEFAR